MKNDEKQGFLRFFARKSTNFTYLFIKKWTSRWKCESCEVTISRQEACAPLSIEIIHIPGNWISVACNHAAVAGQLCVCLRLTEDVNSRAELVERDENGVMVYEDTLRQDAVNAMEALAQKYPDLQGYYPEPKEVMLPWVLSVQKITGIC